MKTISLRDAALAYADKMEKYMLHEEKKVNLLQQAASAARKGDKRLSDSLSRQASQLSLIVFDFTDVGKNLVIAARKERKNERKAS